MNARTRRMRLILRLRRHHRKQDGCARCRLVQRRVAAWNVAVAIMDKYGSVQAFLDDLREDQEEIEPGVTLVRNVEKAGPVGIGTPTGPAL